MSATESWGSTLYKIFLSILETILLIPVLLVSILFSNIVKLIVRLQHGKKFTIMESRDSVWFCPTIRNKGVLNMVLEVQSDKYDSNNCDTTLISDIKCAFNIFFKENSQGTVNKLRQLVKKKYGYNFWVQQENFNIDDYVKKLELSSEYPNEEDIRVLVSQMSSSNLPYDHTATWEMYVCEKAVQKLNIQNDSNLKTFFIVFRVHHSVGDSMSIFKMLQTSILDIDLTNERIIPSSKVQWSFLKFLRMYKEVASSLMISKFAKFPKDPLHIKNISGKANKVWITDTPDVLKLIKEIRKKVPQYKAMKILCTAYILAFSKYCKKKSPGEILNSTITVSYIKRMKNCGFQYKNLPLQLTNDSEAINLKLKTVTENIPYECVIDEVCEFVDEEKLQEILEFQMTNLNLCVYPEILLDLFLTLLAKHLNCGISNLPGFPKATLCGNRKLENIFFLAPNVNYTGLCITIFSYGDELKFGLTADTALIKTGEQTREFLENFISEIKNIHQSICQTKL